MKHFLHLFLVSLFLINSISPFLWGQTVKINTSKEKVIAKGATENQVIMAVQTTNKNGKTVIKAQWQDLTIPNDSIQSSHIQDGAIESRHLAPDAIGANQIADGAITGDNIADGAITNSKVLNIDGSKIILSTLTKDHLSETIFPANAVVNPAGKAYFTDISTALNSVSSMGGKILLSEGIYNLTTINVTQDNVTIQGQGNNTRLYANGTVLQVNANGFLLRDVMLVNQSNTDPVIKIYGNEIKIENNEIYGGDSSIEVNNSTNIWILSNTITSSTSNTYTGIDFNNVDQSWVKNNFIETPTGNHIAISIDVNSSKNMVISNHINHHGGTGIMLDGSGTNRQILSQNLLSGTGTAIVSNHNQVIITSNTVENTLTNSLQIGPNATQNLVSQNLLDGSIISQNTTNANHAIFSNIASGITVNDSSTQPGNTTGGASVDDLDELNTIVP